MLLGIIHTKYKIQYNIFKQKLYLQFQNVNKNVSPLAAK